MAQPTDLDTALVDLAQKLGDVSFGLRTAIELRHTADHLLVHLKPELRDIRLMIHRILPHLP